MAKKAAATTLIKKDNLSKAAGRALVKGGKLAPPFTKKGAAPAAAPDATDKKE